MKIYGALGWNNIRIPNDGICVLGPRLQSRTITKYHISVLLDKHYSDDHLIYKYIRGFGDTYHLNHIIKYDDVFTTEISFKYNIFTRFKDSTGDIIEFYELMGTSIKFIPLFVITSTKDKFVCLNLITGIIINDDTINTDNIMDIMSPDNINKFRKHIAITQPFNTTTINNTTINNINNITTTTINNTWQCPISINEFVIVLITIAIFSISIIIA